MDILEEKISDLEKMVMKLTYIQLNTEMKIQKLTEDIREDRKRMNKEWGNLANKLGTIAEDMVAPNITWIGEKYFNLKDCLSFTVRTKKKKPADTSREREFDIIAVYKDKLILNETKSTARMTYAEDFVDFIKNKEFYEYFPEYNDKEIIPVFASLYIPEEVVRFFTKKKIYVMAMSEETMDLLNPGFKIK